MFVALVLATIAVFLIGDNRRAWDRKVTLPRGASTTSSACGRARRCAWAASTSARSPTSSTARRPTTTRSTSRSPIARNEARRVRHDTVARDRQQGPPRRQDGRARRAASPPKRARPQDNSSSRSEEDPSDMGKAIERMTDVAKKADAHDGRHQAGTERAARRPADDRGHQGQRQVAPHDPRRRREQQGRRRAQDDLRPRGGAAHRPHPRATSTRRPRTSPRVAPTPAT